MLFDWGVWLTICSWLNAWGWYLLIWMQQRIALSVSHRSRVGLWRSGAASTPQIASLIRRSCDTGRYPLISHDFTSNSSLFHQVIWQAIERRFQQHLNLSSLKAMNKQLAQMYLEQPRKISVVQSTAGPLYLRSLVMPISFAENPKDQARSNQH